MKLSLIDALAEKKKSLSMKTAAALAVSLLFVIFAAAATYFSVSFIEVKFKQSIADQQYAMASSISSGIDDKLVMLQKALIAASTRVPPGLIANTEEAQRFLDERVTLHSLFDTTLFLLDKNGTMIAESPYQPDRRGMSLAYREYFQKTVAGGKPVISSPYISSMSHRQPVVMFTAPIFDSQGRLACVLCGGLRLMGENLLSKVPQVKIGTSGYFYLATPDRIIVAHPNKAKIMKSASPPGTNKLFDRAIAGFEGSGETINSDRIPMLASFRHLRATDWILALSLPINEAYAAIYKTRQYLIGGIAAGTLAMLAIAWLVMQRLTMPLVNFARQVEAMPEGRDICLTDTCPSAEICTLTSAFNRLIARLHQQQEILRENEKRYRIVADNTYNWEFWLHPDNRFIYSSPSCERMTGITAAEFMKNPDLLMDLIHPEDRRKFREHRNDAVSKQCGHDLEFRIVRASDGKVRWIYHLCQPVYDDDMRYLGARGSNIDVTDRKKTEETIRALNADLSKRAKELEAANSELESFSYTVSHDLRTPLTHISLSCQAIRELWNTGNMELSRECLDEIFVATHRMDELISALLDFSHTSRRVLSLVEVNLSDMARSSIAGFQLENPERQVIFTCAEEVTVIGDVVLLRIALANILQNAWKYTGKKDTAVIEFGVQESEAKQAYFVRDNGVGFDMSQADDMFKPFQRLSGKHEFNGHGIGLATVERIISRHGGSVWAEGEVGKGATIFFTL